MKIARSIPLVAAVLCVAAVSAHAQSGCTDSPEASTDVLMLVGSVGMVQGSLLLQRALRRRRGR